MQHVSHPMEAASSVCPSFPTGPVGLVCYPGIPLDQISPAFETLAFRVRCDLEWIASEKGSAALADGTPIKTVRSLEDGVGHLALLVLPCGIVSSGALAKRSALLALLQALRRADRVLLLAKSAREARCAQLLFRPVSHWTSGAFWGLFQSGRDPRETLFIRDEHLCWAVGPSAAFEAASRLATSLIDLRSNASPTA